MLSLVGSLGPSEEIELDSRLFYLPAVYLDPWTKEAIDDYRAKIKEKPWDPEFIADAKKSKLDLSPLSGEELEKTVLEIYDAEPDVVARLKDILK